MLISGEKSDPPHQRHLRNRRGIKLPLLVLFRRKLGGFPDWLQATKEALPCLKSYNTACANYHAIRSN